MKRYTLLLLTLAFVSSAFGQAPVTGFPPYGSFGGGTFDAINLQNLNINLRIPIIHKRGRGQDFNFFVVYDSWMWTKSGGAWVSVTDSNGRPTWGWKIPVGVKGQLTASSSLTPCVWFDPDGFEHDEYTNYWWNFIYTDPAGTPHEIDEAPYYDSATTCGYSPVGQTPAGATDGSGIQMQPSFNMIIPDGAQFTSSALTDRNGNKMTLDSSGHFYDTMSSSTPVVTVAGSGTPSSPVTLTYTAPSGGSASYTMKYTSYTVQTNFACSGIHEYGPIANNLVSEIDLPDWNATTNPNSKYTFTYEPTPGAPANVTGRLKSVTLPTGGTISYSYSGGNNGINCVDGSTATLTRTTPDGTWTYAQVKGSGAASNTTITDPQNNQRFMQFQGIYETQRQAYQGSTSGTPLLSINTCYNGAALPCFATANLHYPRHLASRWQNLKTGKLLPL